MSKALNDLKKRGVVSLISITLLFTLIYFSNYYLMSWLIAFFVSGLCAVALSEASVMVKKVGVRVHQKQLSMIGTIVVFSGFLGQSYGAGLYLPFFFLFAGSVYLATKQFNQISGSVATLGVNFFLLTYIAIPLTLLFPIFYPALENFIFPQDGRMWIAYLLIVTKVVDILAYFSGRLYGRRLLAKKLSPKKTWEGSVIGFLGAIGVSVLFAFFTQQNGAFTFELSLYEAIWLGALIGAFGQVGDLIESLIKRDSKVKDSSYIPGLGGILDMLDSVLITIPILYFFMVAH